ncbi:MAG: HEAT repeat domain-containing protein, partial [Persicimonas sp.]
MTTLRQALPALVIRLDGESVDEVERRVGARKVKQESFVDEFVDAHVFIDEQLALWAKLTQCLEALHGEWRARREAFAAFSTKYFNQPTGRARRGVMLQHLREHSASRRDFRRDRRALDDYLDFDVLRERHQRQISQTIGHIRVILYAMPRLAADMLARLDHQEDAELAAVQCLRSVESAGRLGAYFQYVDAPDLLLQALLALYPMMSLLLRHSPSFVRADWVRRLVLLINGGEAASWVQIAALRILVHDRQSGVEIVENRFMRDSGGPDDWHVRAHCARLLGEHAPDRALEVLADGDDASQSVAMAIAETLGGLASTRAVEHLERLAMVRTEPRPKVRGAALLALARQIEWGGEVATAAADVLMRGLQREPEAWIIGCLHEELEALLDRLAESDPEAASQDERQRRDARVLSQGRWRRSEAKPSEGANNKL